MLKLETILNENAHIFDTLARYWRQITGGALLLLAADGSILRPLTDTSPLPKTRLEVQPDESLQISSTLQLVSTPLRRDKTHYGYLIGKNTTERNLALLQWMAEVFLDRVENEQALQGMTDELISAWDQLDLVYRMSQTFAREPNLIDALTSILNEIISVVKVENGFIRLFLDDQAVYVTAGRRTLPKFIFQPEFAEELLAMGPTILFNTQEKFRQLRPDLPVNILNLLGITINIADDTSALLGLMNHMRHNFSAGDVKLVTAISEQIGAIINNFKLQQEIIVQERVQRELEIAAEIQESLLPLSIPDVSGVSIDVSNLPAYEVGGDCYDFFRVAEHQLVIVVGDVAGKGVPAAMFTSLARTMLKVEAAHNQEPHIILKRVNEALYQDLWQAELFITAFIATFDSRHNVLLYANAGHVPGIIYHTQSKTSRLLKATSLPFGLSGYDYKTTQYVPLAPGDLLILFTDGISEAQNPQNELFGLQRIQRLVHQHADKSPAILKQIILKSVAEFRQTAMYVDDVTLVVVKFTLENVKSQPLEAQTVLKKIPFEYAADLAALADISQCVTAACRSLENLPADSKRDDFIYLVELAVSEICTNMIEHAYANHTGNITGQISLTDVGVQIDIYDQGISFNPNAVPPPISDPMDPTEGGYGLHIVRQIMDVAEYQANTAQGNHWRLVKYMPT